MSKNEHRFQCHLNTAKETKVGTKRFINDPARDDHGMRLTDCCGATSTFFDTTLVCRCCYRDVAFGEGDGLEWMDRRKVEQVAYVFDLKNGTVHRVFPKVKFGSKVRLGLRHGELYWVFSDAE